MASLFDKSTYFRCNRLRLSLSKLHSKQNDTQKQVKLARAKEFLFLSITCSKQTIKPSFNTQKISSTELDA